MPVRSLVTLNGPERSIAALYGFHGVLLLIVARKPAQHRPIVRYIGILNLVFGTLMVGIDVNAGMPTLWTVAEGPPIAVFGVLVLYLSHAAHLKARPTRGGND